jgi:hypothetical protein
MSKSWWIPAAAVVLILVAGYGGLEAAGRVVLLEQSMNVGCGCASCLNPSLDSLLSDYGYASVVAVRYHGDTPWAFDPFYNANVGEVEERFDYYSISLIPITVIDGSPLERTCYAIKVRDALDSALEGDSPLRLSASESRVGDSCFVDVRIVAETAVDVDSLVLRTAVIEDSIDYEAPNGMSVFNNVFRRFVPDHAGIIFGISQGETLDFDCAFEIDPAWNPDHISAVAFCQDDTSRTVIQAVSTRPRPSAWGRYWASQRGRVVQAGDDVQFPSILTNLGAQTDTFDVDFTPDLPGDWSAQYSISGGTQVGDAVVLESDSSATIDVSINCGLASGTGRCTVTLTSRCDPSFSRGLSFFAVSGVCVLVVDDDGGLDVESYYADALDSLGVLWGHWDRSIAKPSASDLHRAELVIWFTGSHYPTLEVYDQDLISDYVDAGGDLLVTGQDIGYALNYTNSEEYSPEAVDFYENYLHAEWVTSSSLIWEVSGRAGDPISDGLSFSIAGGDGADNQDYPDVIEVITPAELVFDYAGDSTKHCGTSFDSGSSRVVYLSFGFEAISTVEDRELLLSRILNWFGQISGLEPPSASLVVSAYPNPALTHLNIAWSLSGEKRAVEVYDVLGRLVRSLGGPAGAKITWDLKDEANRRVAPGVYFVSVSTTGQAIHKKVILTP